MASSKKIMKQRKKMLQKKQKRIEKQKGNSSSSSGQIGEGRKIPDIHKESQRSKAYNRIAVIDKLLEGYLQQNNYSKWFFRKNKEKILKEINTAHNKIIFDAEFSGDKFLKSDIPLLEKSDDDDDDEN